MAVKKKIKKKAIKKSAKKQKKSSKIAEKRPKKADPIKEEPKKKQEEYDGPKYLTRRQFAKLLNVAYNTVTYAIEKGRIRTTPVEGRDMVEVIPQRAAFYATKKKAINPTVMGEGKDNHGVLMSIADANLRKAVYQSKTMEMEYWTRMEQLIPMTRINTIWRGIAKDLQKSIMSIPARVGPLMAGIKDPHEATQTLKHELIRALTEISEKGLQHDLSGYQGGDEDANSDNAEMAA